MSSPWYPTYMTQQHLLSLSSCVLATAFRTVIAGPFPATRMFAFSDSYGSSDQTVAYVFDKLPVTTLTSFSELLKLLIDEFLPFPRSFV